MKGLKPSLLIPFSVGVSQSSPIGVHMTALAGECAASLFGFHIPPTGSMACRTVLPIAIGKPGLRVGFAPCKKKNSETEERAQKERAQEVVLKK